MAENRIDVIIAIKDAYSAAIKKLNKSFTTTAKQILPSVATAARVMGAAVVAGFGVSIKAAADFQAQMANVNTMLDAQGTKLLPQMTRAVNNMAVAYGEGTKTLTKGLYDILSASIPAEKAISVLDTSVRAAKAGLTDTGIAADAITTILNSYQLSAEKAADVSDFFFTIVKRGKTTFAELAPTIGRVASLAASSGVSMEEMGAVLSTLTRGGIKTEEAMTGLRAMLTAVSGASEESATVFREKVGLELDSVTLKTQGLTGMLKAMADARLTPEELKQIFPNVRAAAAAAAAMQQISGLTEDLAAQYKRTGATQEAYRKQTMNLSFAMSQVRELMNAARRVIGTHFIPVLTQMANKLVANKDQILEWARIIGVEGVKAFKVMASTIQQLAPIIVSLIPVFRNVSTIILQIFSGIGVAIESIKAFVEAMVAGIGVRIGQIWGIFSEEGKQFAEISKQTLDEISADWTAKMNNVANEQDKMMQGFSDVDLSGFGINLTDDLIKVDPTVLQSKLDESKQSIDEYIAEVQAMIEEAEARKREINLETSEYAASLEQASLDQQLTLFEAEVEAKRMAMLEKLKINEEELKAEGRYAELGAKMERWEARARMKVVGQYAAQRIGAAQNIAQNLLQTAVLVMGGEQQAFRKRKDLVIALIAAEKSLAIAKIWASNAGKPWGIAQSIAQSAQIGAQFAAQVGSLKAAASQAQATPGIPGVTGAGAAAGEAPAAPLPTAAPAAAGVAAATTAAPQMTQAVFHLGGVTNVFDIERLESMELENLESVMSQITEAVRDKTVEGFDLAMQIFRTGQLNPGLAV